LTPAQVTAIEVTKNIHSLPHQLRRVGAIASA